MAIGKKPTKTPTAINLESPEVENFINGGMNVPATEPQETTAVHEVTEDKQETRRGRKTSVEAGKVKYYNLPIPEELFEGIEEYIFKNRKEKKVTIRAFIVDCIKKELERENLI